MNFTSVEELYSVFNETAFILQEELSCDYLEALAETGENLFHNSVLQEEVSEVTRKRLLKKYSEAGLANYTNEQIRKAYQLAILKGMKENVQPNHQMTPDAVGLLVAFLVQKFIRKDTYRLLDPAVGTANLLTTVLNQHDSKTIDAIGVDVDDLLLKLAYVNSNLQQHPIEFYNQDSLQPLFVDPADAIVCDLPVGFYPDDVRASEYEIHAKQGHTYAHHLFIEQSTRHLLPGGYMFLIIPNNLFESEQAHHLHEFIKDHLIVQALLQLPESLFKNKQSGKSVLILQKKSEDTVPPKQALLVNLPSFSNKGALEPLMTKIDQWINENKH